MTSSYQINSLRDFFEKGEEASKLKRSLGYKNESATISALQNAGYLQDK